MAIYGDRLESQHNSIIELNKLHHFVLYMFEWAGAYYYTGYITGVYMQAVWSSNPACFEDPAYPLLETTLVICGGSFSMGHSSQHLSTGP